MRKKLEIAGQKFGRLTACKETNKRADGKVVWECMCDCGNKVEVSGKLLKSGNTKSCGCIAAELLSARNMKYPYEVRHLREYIIWAHIKSRCYNKNDAGYKDYGGRGIGMHVEWISNPIAFIEYIGKRPSPKHSIDRIDNDGNYEPGNVRWATRSDQARNTRKTKLNSKIAKAIRFMRKENVMFKDIAKFFGINICLVENVVYNKAWVEV